MNPTSVPPEAARPAKKGSFGAKFRHHPPRSTICIGRKHSSKKLDSSCRRTLWGALPCIKGVSSKSENTTRCSSSHAECKKNSPAAPTPLLPTTSDFGTQKNDGGLLPRDHDCDRAHAIGLLHHAPLRRYYHCYYYSRYYFPAAADECAPGW